MKAIVWTAQYYRRKDLKWVDDREFFDKKSAVRHAKRELLLCPDVPWRVEKSVQKVVWVHNGGNV